MSDNNYIKDFLQKLGFVSDLYLYNKEYKLNNYTIKIDLQKGKINYRNDDKTTVERVEDGQIQIGDKTTSNFSQPENFVVLEVVDRLLTKGYLPNDIHLERRYPSGRGASGGKSDVCVYGKDGKSLMVIECKTWGAEFERERNKMEEHGGQLFAYLANDQNTKFLVLYASRLNEEGKFDYENLIVPVKDREEDLKKSLKQIEEENIKLYRDANNKGELYEVWKEEFSLYFHFNGIFDDDANAYSLELKALKKKNLKPLDDSQGLFNKFAEILRHNNISDNANAFNKILSLFLCKIVDEEKNDEDILDFQVKEDEEYEHLIDRLQFLYQKGMQKLNEEIVYYSEDDFFKILKLYPQQTPIERLGEVFKELKYYTNNEFAFKEVHNKKLFIQNGRVLTEIVKLIQNFRFRYNSQQQVLGDFFELMLNHGVKQSEGQFFTPIPIVRYIILSLGFEKVIAHKLKNNNKEDFLYLPKIIDYACGAGHFLTESIEELQNIIKKIDTSKLTEDQQAKIEKYRKNTHWAKDYIYGIEKDYRLARTSQIACYINGDGDANIIFGDGLESHDTLKTDKNKFDIVVANPPYSVSSFKNYLNVGKTNFELYEHLTEKSSQIEALFIERTKQILADNGLAGIILPSTILSNTGIYTKVREILLKYFEIKAITELGSKTFIATGTTTVILFLKRRNDDFLKDREYIARDFYNHIPRPEHLCYIDEYRFLKMFTDHRDLDYDDYNNFLAFRSLLSNHNIPEKLAETEIFKEYKDAFNNSADIVNLKKKTFFKNYTTAEQEQELAKRLYNYCKNIEKEKFLYFMLCLGDGEKEAERVEEYYKPQQTIIVKTGNDNETQKEFLGYEFQGKKGQEGIKIYNYGGKLFDTKNYYNPQKANSYIRQHITNGFIPNIENEQKDNIVIFELIELMDFNKVEFDKTINTGIRKENKLKSKFPIYKLGEICNIKIGGTPSRANIEYYQDGNNLWVSISEMNGQVISDTKEKITDLGVKKSNVKLIKKGTTLLSFKLSIGKTAIAGEDLYTNEAIAGLEINENFKEKLSNSFIFKIFNAGIIDLEKIGNNVFGKSLNSEFLKNEVKFPIPPLEIQEKIISDIEQIEQKESKAIERIKELEQDIQTEFQQVVRNAKSVKIEKICTSQSGGTPKTEVAEYWANGTINWLRSEVCQNCFVYEDAVKEKITALGLEKSSAKLFSKDTVLIALVGATIGRVAYLTFEAATNQNIAGLYPKDENELLSKYLYYALLNDFDKNFGDRKGKFTMANMSMIRNLEIPLPNIDEQKKLIEKIDKKEAEITKIKESLSNIQNEKEEVLRKYL